VPNTAKFGTDSGEWMNHSSEWTVHSPEWLIHSPEPLIHSPESLDDSPEWTSDSGEWSVHSPERTSGPEEWTVHCEEATGDSRAQLAHPREAGGEVRSRNSPLETAREGPRPTGRCPMSDEAAFLTALKANPADDLTRLVYADWLDEHGEPQKAHYLRAVVDLTQLQGGKPEYNDAAGRLYTSCGVTDAGWRREAGARFDVVLTWYEPAHKIYTIKIIREQTGFGLAEAKALSQSIPIALFSWLPFELALPRLLAFSWRGSHSPRFPIDATIRPTPWPDSAPGTVFDVFLYEYHPEPHLAVHGLALLLGVTTNEVRERLKNLPLVLATGIRPTAVADFVRRAKMACNFSRPLPADAIRVVPRSLTT
jgi:uncharacterized protein (TIGR02996 family)